MKNLLRSYPSVAFVAPFGTFILLLSLRNIFPVGLKWQYPLAVLITSVVLLITSRGVVKAGPVHPFASCVVGLLVFAVWIGPDVIASSYRHHWLFENSVTGYARSSMPLTLRSDVMFLTFRAFGTAFLVPIIEELFWRAWMMRYLINQNFSKVPLGSYSAISYWLTAILFASEHGPYWDVGLIAGLIYNSWFLRVRNVADAVIAHAVTNGCLAILVIVDGRWQYWL